MSGGGEGGCGEAEHREAAGARGREEASKGAGAGEEATI